MESRVLIYTRPELVETTDCQTKHANWAAFYSQLNNTEVLWQHIATRRARQKFKIKTRKLKGREETTCECRRRCMPSKQNYLNFRHLFPPLSNWHQIYTLNAKPWNLGTPTLKFNRVWRHLASHDISYAYMHSLHKPYTLLTVGMIIFWKNKKLTYYLQGAHA